MKRLFLRGSLVESLTHEKVACRDGASGILISTREVRAILPLIKLLNDRNNATRGLAAFTLHRLGDADALARSVIKDAYLTVPQKVQIYDALKHTRKRAHYNGATIRLSYNLADIDDYCHKMLDDSDPAMAAKAAAIKYARELLTPSHRNGSGDAPQLLRAVPNRSTHEGEEELLQAAESTPTGLWKCEFGHQNPHGAKSCPQCKSVFHKISQAKKHLHGILPPLRPRVRKSDSD